MIPSFCDMMETSLKNFTLFLITTSVTQMLRCSILIITYVLSLLFLERKAYRHHITGVLLIIFGIVLGGVSQYDPNDPRGLPPIAVIIVLIAQMFGGSGYVIEEKFICQFEDMDPIFMTGV